MSNYSIFVKIFGKRKLFSVDEKTTFPLLMKKISTEYPNLDSKSFYLTCGGQPFNEDTRGTLSANMIASNATLELVIRVLGGLSSSKLNLNFGDVKSTREPCSLYYTEDSTNRVKIKCECAFSFAAIDDYIKSFIKGNDKCLKCPMCNTAWNYLSVRYVLANIKTQMQLEKLDNAVSKKIINSNINLRRCPNCDTLCERQDVNMLRVICQLCKSYDFCWECGGKWRNNAEYCLSPTCNTNESRITILSTCQLKKIDQNIGVPSIRACPKCKCLIEHVDKCKHILCEYCKCEFCHVCLSIKINNTWPCGDAYIKCTIAAIQI